MMDTLPLWSNLFKLIFTTLPLFFVLSIHSQQMSSWNPTKVDVASLKSSLKEPNRSEDLGHALVASRVTFNTSAPKAEAPAQGHPPGSP